MSGNETHDVDVVVIGAGLSGLAAARRLVDNGRSVAVLEAKTHVGGRTRDGWAGTTRVDDGASLVYPVHHNVFRLAAAHRVALFEGSFDGRFLFVSDGVTHTLRLGSTPGIRLLGRPSLRPLLRIALRLTTRWLDLPLPAADLTELIGVIGHLDDLAATVPAQAPWTAPDAVALDRRTLGSWLADELTSPSTRAVVESSLAGFVPLSASLLYTLHFLNTWGGVGSLLFGQQRSVYRFTSGAQGLAVAVAESLGDRVQLGSPVQAIHRQRDRVIVHSATAEFVARRVIAAFTPSGMRAVRFEPELPGDRAVLHDAWLPVHGRKINVVYPEPFWRRAGLSGAALGDLGPIPGVTDVSPRDSGVGILTSYVTVNETTIDPGTRQAAVLAAYARLFGPRALDPLAYVEKNWADEPFAHGCEGGLACGALTTARRLPKEPVGRVHWAGVETADAWMGFMSGAIQAGERAADEVLAAG
ncbi:flavin monoamine oxidase family protein [Nocardia brasiliensis]|uniref:flavin monoamine oxidase family protein n=1 Tax=Nocardia brasiliensis TaxID=37326 RepID=UPI0024567E1D|nr:FAD-dependent oxidoreductase [Nocardia brasiliensis]